MAQKTYGVRGLMEWQVQLPTGFAGKPYITIKFEGGQMTGYGVTPARFTTSDETLQAIIERSEPFRKKKILLLNKSKK